MAVQEAVFFPLPKDLKEDLLKEFGDDPEMARLIEDEAPGLSERLLRFYKQINQRFTAHDVLAVIDDPSIRVVGMAQRIVDVEQLLRRWVRWTETDRRTPEVFKRHFREFFPHAGEDWRRWLDEDPAMISGQLLMARDDLKAGRSALGHSAQESVGERNQAIMYVEFLIEEWDRVLSQNFERQHRQAPAIREELGI